MRLSDLSLPLIGGGTAVMMASLSGFLEDGSAGAITTRAIGLTFLVGGATLFCFELERQLALFRQLTGEIGGPFVVPVERNRELQKGVLEFSTEPSTPAGPSDAAHAPFPLLVSGGMEPVILSAVRRRLNCGASCRVVFRPAGAFGNSSKSALGRLGRLRFQIATSLGVTLFLCAIGVTIGIQAVAWIAGGLIVGSTMAYAVRLAGRAAIARIWLTATPVDSVGVSARELVGHLSFARDLANEEPKARGKGERHFGRPWRRVTRNWSEAQWSAEHGHPLLERVLMAGALFGAVLGTMGLLLSYLRGALGFPDPYVIGFGLAVAALGLEGLRVAVLVNLRVIPKHSR